MRQKVQSKERSLLERTVLAKRCMGEFRERVVPLGSLNTTQRDGMGREEGGGFRMGNTCKPVADSF